MTNNTDIIQLEKEIFDKRAGVKEAKRALNTAKDLYGAATHTCKNNLDPQLQNSLTNDMVNSQARLKERNITFKNLSSELSVLTREMEIQRRTSQHAGQMEQLRQRTPANPTTPKTT